jgi:hypothetical protein
MSQQGILAEGSVVGGDVISLTGDTGGAVPPTLGNINIVGGAGISVSGNPGTSTLTITEDEVNEGTVTTIGAVTGDVITIALGATPSTYTLEARVGLFESTTPAGGGMWVLGVARTTGAAASIVASDAEDTFLEAALTMASVEWVVSANSAILRVTGVAGLTINWAATAEYVVAS